MFTAQIVVVATTEEEMVIRLNEIASQISKGYSSGSSVAKVESFKFIVKESVNGGKAMLPRLPGNDLDIDSADNTAIPYEEQEPDQDDQNNDEAGTMIVAGIPSFVNKLAE